MSISPTHICALGFQTPTGFLCALEREAGPSLLLLPLQAMKSPVSLCHRCVVRLRAQKARLAVKMQATYPLSNPKSKELFLQKILGYKGKSPAASPCMAGAREFLHANSRVPLGKDF